jgi:DNA-binding transcriptional LysR family regulator
MTGEIERTRFFLQVVALRGFAAAARAAKLSPSVATRWVAELEAELGVQLLVRTTRRVSPTVAGRVYAERMGKIVVEIDRTNEFVRQQQDVLKGLLRVSAPLSFGVRFLPSAIAQFRLLHPNVDLKLNLTDRFVDILGEDFEMALRISGPPSDKSTIWRKICVVPRLLVAAPEYLGRMGPLNSPDDLTDHRCLGYSHFSGGADWSLRHETTGEERTIHVGLRLECDNGDALAELAALGEGIALLPRFIVAERIERGVLARILAPWAPPEIWLTALYPPYDAIPAKVLTFTQFIEQLVASDRSMVEGARGATI